MSEIALTRLKGVGPALAERLQRLDIHNVQDLLFHLPLRYQDRTRITPIGQLRPEQDVVLQGQIVSCDVEFGRRRSLLCRISDGSGMIALRFFHFSAAQQRSLSPGRTLRCYGEARSGRTGLELYHPEYLLPDSAATAVAEAHLTPVYPSTEGLQQVRLRRLIEQALEWLDRPGFLQDWLPTALFSDRQFMTLPEAVRYVHQPPPDANVSQLLAGQHPAQQRLALEELLAHRLSLRRLRQQARQYRAPVLDGGKSAIAALHQALPFSLTAAQQRVCAEISHDLEQAQPMLRLLQGDVGAGKTVVAATAALQAVASGYQCAIMAPTELLAEQHLASFSAWLAPQAINIGWLSGKTKGQRRTQALAALASGETRLIIGTHALFQDDVQFARLGLVIIDEQHRFGVQQRMALRDKGGSTQQLPHQLVMTATPIPRTLAMSAYADLEVSVIDALPPGRKPVQTLVISGERREEVMARIHHACLEGQQAYWVCTLIEESEALQAQAAEVTAETLRERLPDLQVALVHGRMKAQQKSDVMQAFKNGEYQMLVATTVIEVGVDVPNATLMVIENAERLGLAQLHQLRGRVGRGQRASHCVLMYQAPLSLQGKERLNIMRDSNDGFFIAERDLALRGPGQVLGTRQTGLMHFRVADLLRDSELLALGSEIGDQLLRHYPHHVEPLIRRWLGQREVYGNV